MAATKTAMKLRHLLDHLGGIDELPPRMGLCDLVWWFGEETLRAKNFSPQRYSECESGLTSWQTRVPVVPEWASKRKAG